MQAEWGDEGVRGLHLIYSGIATSTIITHANAVSNVLRKYTRCHTSYTVTDIQHTDAVAMKQSPNLKVIIENNLIFRTCQKISLVWWSHKHFHVQRTGDSFSRLSFKIASSLFVAVQNSSSSALRSRADSSRWKRQTSKRRKGQNGNMVLLFLHSLPLSSCWGSSTFINNLPSGYF